MKTNRQSFAQPIARQWSSWQPLFFLLTLLLVIAGGSRIVYGQDQNSLTLAVNSSTIYYSTNKTSVQVAPNLTLTSTTDVKLNGAKVFLGGEDFVAASDKLSLGDNAVLQGTEGNNITWEYNQTTGVLTFSGEDTMANYEAALRKITYTYTNIGDPKPKDRTIEISIGNSLFNPENGHFYEFVKNENITWTKAKDDAAARTYEGRQGYLVTVMTEEENRFVADKLQGQGWMGATDNPAHTPEDDNGTDKKWYWATGPEKDTHFFTQNFDANGCGNGPATVQPNSPNGKYYANWANGEPNDADTPEGTQGGGCAGNEDYAHFIQVGGTPYKLGETGQWNDYPDTTAGLDAQYYKVHGYVVEYGGMPGDTPTEPLLTGRVTINYLKCDSCGDVHILTPDGLKYDFQSTGEFLASQSADKQVIVQARQETSPINASVSLNTALALWVAGDKIEFYVKSDSAYYLNGVAAPLPTAIETLPNQGTIEPIGSEERPQFIISWPNGAFAALVHLYPDSHLDYGIAAGEGSQTTYQGFLGNLDGNPQNDLQVKDGDQIKPPPSLDDLNRFGDSWRVPAEASLFTVKRAEDQPDALHTVVNLEEEKRTAAEQTCKEGGISDQTALKNCTYDVAITGDPIFVESAKSVEASVASLPPSDIVPATVGETLGGGIFDANLANAAGITIVDGDDLIITTGKMADGTAYLRFNIYRNGEYVASYSVSTNTEAADTLAKSMAAMYAPEAAQEAPSTMSDQVVTQEAKSFPILPGQTIVREQKIPSESGNHYLNFQHDGNVVVIAADGSYFWGLQTITDKYKEAQSVQMEPDGNFVVRDADGEIIWSALTENLDPSAYLTLTPEGVLQLISKASGKTLWSSQ